MSPHKPRSDWSPPRQCYSADECAFALKMSVDRFYRDYKALVAAGMPASLGLGRYRIPRAAFDAWLNKDHPQVRATPAPANDRAAAPYSDELHRAALRAQYGKSSV